MNFFKKLFFSVSFLCFFHSFLFPMGFSAREHFSTVAVIKKLARSFEVNKTFTLREVIQQLPLIKDIKLPPVAKKFLNEIIFSTPKLKETKNSVEVIFENLFHFGQKKEMIARIYAGPNAQGKEFGLSFGIGIPGVFSYRDIFPRSSMLSEKLEDQSSNAFNSRVELIQFKDAGIVLSVSPFFEDPVWGGLVGGVNLITQVKLGGQLEKLTNFFGQELTTVKFRGLIAPTLNLTGSSIGARLVGTIPLIKFPGFELKAGPSSISIGLSPTTVISWIWGSTGLQIKLPGQKDFFSLKGFITIYASSLSIGGQSVGMIENIFAIPGLDLGNLGVMVTVNYAVAAATAGALPIQGGAITGEIKVGSKRLKLLAKIVPFNPPALPDIVFEGVAEGGLARSDIIEFALKLAYKASKLNDIKIDLAKLKRAFERVLPPFTIGDHKVLLALKTVTVFDKLYLQGFHIKGSTNLAGLGGGFDISASIGGLKGKLYLDEIKIPKKNPIIILSGAGEDGIQGTKDDGPVGLLELSWKNQEIFVDALLSIPPLGINSATRIDITPLGGIQFDVQHKLGGFIDSKLHIEGRPDSLDSFKVSGFFNLGLLNNIRSFLVDKAGRLAQQADVDLKEANEMVKQEINMWLDEQVEEFDQKIVDLDRKIATAKKGFQTTLWKSKKKLLILRRKIKWDEAVAKAATGMTGMLSRAARGALKAAKGLLKLTGKLIGGGFNISEIYFEGRLTDLIKKAKGMKAFVRGRIAGKPFEQMFQLDLNKLDQLPRQILRALRQVVR